MKKGFLSSESTRRSKLRPVDAPPPPRSSNGKFTFEHFELERLLGRGNFSEVFEASEKGTSNLYALKIFDRQEVMRIGKIADVRMERHAMLRLNDPGHPNIVRLIDTFKDQFRVCLVYEMAENGELWENIKHHGIADIHFARHIIAQLVSAVEYMHSKNIVHRDIKAENIILRNNGIIQLIDFGTAMDLDHPEVQVPGLGRLSSCGSNHMLLSNHMTQRRRARNTVERAKFQHYVGTPQFMPPEAIRNQDSGKWRDLWSLGCTIYQIIAGVPPFQASTEYFIYLKVVARDLDFPPDFPELAKDLIEKLVVLDPEKRLGATNGFDEIKNHPFFSQVDFDSYKSKVPFFEPSGMSPVEAFFKQAMKRFHEELPETIKKISMENEVAKNQPEPSGSLGRIIEDESTESINVSSSCASSNRINLPDRSVHEHASSNEHNSQQELNFDDQNTESMQMRQSEASSSASACSADVPRQHNSDSNSNSIGDEIWNQFYDSIMKGSEEFKSGASSSTIDVIDNFSNRLRYYIDQSRSQLAKESEMAEEWVRQNSGRRVSSSRNSDDAHSSSQSTTDKDE